MINPHIRRFVEMSELNIYKARGAQKPISRLYMEGRLYISTQRACVGAPFILRGRPKRNETSY